MITKHFVSIDNQATSKVEKVVDVENEHIEKDQNEDLHHQQKN